MCQLRYKVLGLGGRGVVLQKNIKKLDNFSHFIVHDIGDGSKIACPVGKTTL